MADFFLYSKIRRFKYYTSHIHRENAGPLSKVYMGLSIFRAPL